MNIYWKGSDWHFFRTSVIEKIGQEESKCSLLKRLYKCPNHLPIIVKIRVLNCYVSILFLSLNCTLVLVYCMRFKLLVVRTATATQANMNIVRLCLRIASKLSPTVYITCRQSKAKIVKR